MKTVTDVIAPMLEVLESRKVTILRYAHGELDDGDWHAVSDACQDLRDIDSKIEILQLILGETQ